MSDELHASYSRNLANQSVQKGLIKFAKDRGLTSPEIWQHNGQWAIRYTGTDGEVKQLSLGDVFAKARSVIASLGGKRPQAKQLAGATDVHAIQDVVKELMKRAQALGLQTARITYDGKQFRMQYGGRMIPLGAGRGEAMSKIGKVKPVAASLAEDPREALLKENAEKLRKIGEGLGLKGLKVLWSGADYRATYDGQTTRLGAAFIGAKNALKRLSPKTASLALALEPGPLQRLTALALSEDGPITFRGGQYYQGTKRLGGSEDEATLSLSKKNSR